MVTLLTLVLAMVEAGSVTPEIPCPDFSNNINIGCMCSLNEVNATVINCDNVVFPTFPTLPRRYFIQEFSQRNVGWQVLPSQIFTASDIPLRIVDFSHNTMRRIVERLFDGVEDTLEEINLSYNRLGDNTQPIFSSSEFQHLKQLRLLDLSYNGLKRIADNIIKGCDQLKELRLDGNSLSRVPTESLIGPDGLQTLHLQDNRIELLTPLMLATQPNLLSVNLTNNVVREVQPGAFANMTRLVLLILSKNKIERLEDQAFAGLNVLLQLSLDNNFLDSVPTRALAKLPNLKFLNLGSNRIQVQDRKMPTKLI